MRIASKPPGIALQACLPWVAYRVLVSIVARQQADTSPTNENNPDGPRAGKRFKLGTLGRLGFGLETKKARSNCSGWKRKKPAGITYGLLVLAND